jgi:hypothetical protein
MILYELSGVPPVSRYITSAPTGVPPVSRYITSAPTAQKTSHAFLIVACRPIAAEMRLLTSALRSNVRDTDLIENSFSVEICLRSRCLATVCVNMPQYEEGYLLTCDAV